MKIVMIHEAKTKLSALLAELGKTSERSSYVGTVNQYRIPEPDLVT